jgi:hypothetical protein
MTTSLNDIRIATVLDGMEEDRKYAAQSNKVTRIKIPKGHAWLIRFLPFAMGTRGLPYARLAQHWISSKPCYCKQHTSPEFGGDPNYECPICSVADNMYNQADNEADRDDFYSVQVRVVFTMYCVVIAKETDRGVREDSTFDEMLIPCEFNLPKTSFALLAQKIERSKARKGGSPNMGLLDLELGQDVWCIRDKMNALSFELSDDGPAPLYELNDQFDANVARLWKSMKQPNVKFLDDVRLNAIADKVAERAFEKAASEMGEAYSNRGGSRTRGERHGGGSARGNRENDDEPRGRSSRGQSEPEISRPTRRPAPPQTAAPSRSVPSRGTRAASVASATIDEAEGQAAPPEDDSNPELMPVPQNQRRSQVRQEEAQEQPQEQEQDPNGPEQDDPRNQEQPQDPEQDQPQEQEQEPPAPPVRRAVASTSRPAPATRPAAPSAAVQAGRRAQAPQPSVRTAPAARNESATGQVADDPEELPEEANDPAPSKPEALPPRSAAPSRAAAPAAAPTTNRFAAALGPRIQGLRSRQQ